MKSKITHSFHGRMMLCILLSAAGMLVIMLTSYRGFTDVIQDQLLGKIDAIRTQIEKTIAGDIATIGSTVRLTGYTSSAQTFLLSNNPQNVIFSSAGATEFWSYAFQQKSICKNIYLYSQNGRYLSYSNEYREIFRTQLKKYGFYDSVALSEPFFSDVFYLSDDGVRALSSPESNRTPYTLYFAPVYSASPEWYSGSNGIVAAVLCDMTSFTDWLQTEYASSSTSILINNRLVSTSGAEFPDELSRAFRQLDSPQQRLVYDGKTYLATTLRIPKLDAALIYMVDEAELYGPLFTARNLNLAILLLVTGITVTLTFLILRNADNSVRAIVSDTTRLRAEEGITRVRASRLHEFNAISDSINGMLCRIDDAAERERQNSAKLYEAMLAQNRAELIGYRSQINPHFLFNTLECMRSMAHVYSAPPLESMVSSMAQMFRYSLYSAMFVTLQNELEHVKSYVNVMKIRYPNRFFLTVQITEAAELYPVVSMILQPLVENSILHAFPQKQPRCCISIRAFVRPDGLLCVRVADNGVGLSPEQITAIRATLTQPEPDVHEQKSSISLQNIFRRMRLTFGEEFTIDIFSKATHYTVVELTIPRRLSENFQPLL